HGAPSLAHQDRMANAITIPPPNTVSAILTRPRLSRRRFQVWAGSADVELESALPYVSVAKPNKPRPTYSPKPANLRATHNAIARMIMMAPLARQTSPALARRLAMAANVGACRIACTNCQTANANTRAPNSPTAPIKRNERSSNLARSESVRTISMPPPQAMHQVGSGAA